MQVLPIPGKLLLLVWSVYCMFIVFFYTSNLRAFLISPADEELIDHPEQVIARGQKMFIPKFYRLSRLENISRNHEIEI